MKELIISTLETLYPDNVYLQGTLNEDEAYPESFITFYITNSDDKTFYDDDSHSCEWDISVIFYSSNPQLVETEPIRIRQAMKAAGFIPQGKGNDIPSDRISHTGWAMEFYYKEF